MVYSLPSMAGAAGSNNLPTPLCEELNNLYTNAPIFYTVKKDYRRSSAKGSKDRYSFFCRRSDTAGEKCGRGAHPLLIPVVVHTHHLSPA
jgi:hypothetical protein